MNIFTENQCGKKIVSIFKRTKNTLDVLLNADKSHKKCYIEIKIDFMNIHPHYHIITYREIIIFAGWVKGNTVDNIIISNDK